MSQNIELFLKKCILFYEKIVCKFSFCELLYTDEI